MILSFVILCLPVLQDSSDAKQNPPAEAPVKAPAKARQWWTKLNPEERRQILERHQRFQGLSHDSKAEMRRRMDLVRSEIGDIRKGMNSEESAKLEKMSERERRHFLHQQARIHFRDSAERMERRQPGAHDRFRQMDMEERFRRSAETLERDRRGRVQHALHRAATEGWIDEKIAAGMKDLPLEEAMALLGQVHKHRFIQRATEKGFWQQQGISAADKEVLIALPPKEFFRRLGRAPRGSRHPNSGVHSERGARPERGPHPERGARPRPDIRHGDGKGIEENAGKRHRPREEADRRQNPRQRQVPKHLPGGKF